MLEAQVQQLAAGEAVTGIDDGDAVVHVGRRRSVVEEPGHVLGRPALLAAAIAVVDLEGLGGLGHAERHTDGALDQSSDHRDLARVAVQPRYDDDVVVEGHVLDHDGMRRVGAAVEAGQHEAVIRVVHLVPAQERLERVGDLRPSGRADLIERFEHDAGTLRDDDVVVAVGLDPGHALGDAATSSELERRNDRGQHGCHVGHQACRHLGPANELEVVARVVQDHAVPARNQTLSLILVEADAVGPRIRGVEERVRRGHRPVELCRCGCDAHCDHLVFQLSCLVDELKNH